MAKKTISNTFTVNTVEDGENAFEVTLDTQIVGVECDSGGNIIDSTPITLHLSAYYGNGEDLIAECYISESHDDDNIIVSEVDTGVIGVELTQGAYLAPSNPIVLTVRHSEYGTRVVTFSLNRVVNGKNGENSIRLDLNNEGDTMLYDGAGNLLSGSVSTTATLYDGGTVVSNASFSILGYSGMDSSKVSISGSTVTVSGMTSDSGYVDIRASYNGNYYTHRFTLKKIVGVDKFDIVVSPNAVSINTSDTTIADTPINIQVYRTPSNGGARQLVSWTKENGAYHAYGLTLVVKDGLNNALTETTSGTPVDTRIFNLTGTMVTNTDSVSVTLSKSSVVQDVETIPVSHVRNGQDGMGANAVRIDLSNEMDSIPTDVDGKVLSQITIATAARIYNGASLVTSGVDAVSVGRIANIQGTVNGSVPPVSNLTDGLANVQWTIPANTVLSAGKYSAQIVLTWTRVVNGQSVTDYYFATFVATVVKSGEPGVSPEIMSLLPSPNQIIFPKDSSGTIPSTSKTLSLKIKKTIGNTTEVKDVDQSGLTIRYSTVAMPATVSDGTAWSGDISIQSTVTYSNVYIAAFDGNTLVDTETIPIIKDGVDGVDYTIQSSIESIKIPSNQTTTSKTITFKFYSKTGGADKQAFRTYYTIYRRATNGVYTKVSPESATWATEATVTIDNISVAYNAIVVYIWGDNATSYYDGMRPETQAPKPYLTKLEIPIIKDGNTGQRGKIGRFYYYSGFDWDADNENDTFVVNDAQVPWFSKAGSDENKNYVFNPETIPASGQMTMAQMAAATTVDKRIQWNNAPWEVMTDDFKYLITQAIFGAYAHLGSWIFNNDYMLSEKDKDGVPRGQRTYNGMDDNQLTTGFIPSIAFDALNGRASFGGDTVRFQPDGSGWLANKSIIWDEDGNASFSGFIKKTPTHITPENESEYIINYFSTLYTFDFQKTGTFVVLQPNVSCDTLHLPCLYQNVAHYYDDEQKMIIRGYVGTKILIYNVSGHGLTIYYMYNSNGGSYSDVLGNGSCATAECKIRTESGIENVYWEFVHCGYIL